MSAQEQLRPAQHEEEDQEYLAEDDVEEVEEIEEQGDDQMDSGDEGEGFDEQDGEHADDAMDMLDNGLDDSFATSSLHQAAVFTLQVHPVDSNLAVSGGEDDLAYIFRTDSGAEVKKLEGHSDSVTSCGWNFDGTMVATGGMDGKVIVWRAQGTGEFTERQWDLLHSLEGPDEVNWIDWHPKGNLLLAGGADGTVWLWNLPSGNTLHVLSGHVASVTAGRFTPDGKKILTASEDSTLILWDPREGTAIHKLSPSDARFKLESGINCLAINPSSTVAILGGAEGGLRAVNLIQGTVLAQMTGHEEGASIEMVAFNEVPKAGGAAAVTVVVSVGTDGRVCTWEASSFRLRSTGSHEDAVTSLSFSPHTPTFLTGSADKTLKLWDYRTGSCVKTLLGNRDIVHAVSLSADGKTVVSGSEDGTVRTFRPDEERHPQGMEE
ncbi:WD40 repeat domain-containing protein [Sporobolomyces koalae]|uniref:WD40 repeat domain-containing protein n=1 Tax=Sporobolomyces koalae TaxID=500713 RepID=UPI0031813E38